MFFQNPRDERHELTEDAMNAGWVDEIVPVAGAEARARDRRGRRS